MYPANRAALKFGGILTKASEAAVSAFVPEVCMPVRYHKRTFSFYVTCKLSCAQFRRYTHRYADMAGAGLRFDDFCVLLPAQFALYCSCICFFLSIYLLSSILWCKRYTVLNHTLRDKERSYETWFSLFDKSADLICLDYYRQHYMIFASTTAVR